MRHHPSCWNKVLAKLGFRRVPRQQQRAAFGGRLSRIEALEARQMMTAATVNTLADVVDSTDAYTSLREAIADSAVNSISFDSSLNGGRILLTQGELGINKPITITGPGADRLAIDAAGTSRVMRFGGTITNAMTVSGLTITGGNSIGGGGGIYNAANLTLISVDVSGNVTDTFGGGVALHDGSKLTVYSSTIHDNRAGGYGGSIGGHINAADSVTIVQSTISNNVAPNGGGLGIVSTHATPASAGVLFSRSTITQNIAANGVGGSGGGVYNVNGATMTSHGSIIAGNIAGGTDNSDIYGAFNPGSTHNLIGRPGNSGLTNTMGNLTGTNAVPLDPKLSPLDNHGGSTKTHVPLPGSPAIDAGNPYNASYSPLVDQRGFDRRADRETPNAFPGNENWEDIGAVELSAAVGPAGDFNGDGREDQLILDETTRSLNVAVRAATSGNYDVEAWGILPSEVSAASTFVVGDFNGDGRDDVLIRTSTTAHVGVSDGASFSFHAFQTLPLTWQDIYAGDVDGDGDDELVGWNANTSTLGWQVADFTAQTGQFALNVSWGSVNLLHEAGARHFIADANGDGRHDLIRRTSGGAWGVALSQGNQFVSQPNWSTTWFNGFYDAAANTLVANGPLKKILNAFEEVYNNVELELYPGLMKGPNATRQTKAGNNWDQAALLEEELQNLGLADVKIASGRVRASVAQIREWSGLKQSVNDQAVLTILRGTLDDAAQLIDSTIEFTHAWVQAFLPTAAGLAWVNLDPSWKFKDRQPGIPLAAELDSVHTNLSTGVFDEFSYFALDPTTDRRLPIEFFEDQVMDWLTTNSTWQGSSLAEVPYDGPIRAKQFETLPAGFSDGMTLAPTPGVVQYNDFNAIALDPLLSSQLTHRVTISLRKNDETAAHWTHDLVVPSHSLETIQVTFGSSSATGVMTDPNSIATAGPYFSRLVVNGSVVKWAAANESFAATDAVKIELRHLAPTSLVDPLNDGEPGYVPPGNANYAGPTYYDRKFTFTEKPGDILAFGLEANQYSRDSLADMQAAVLAAVAGKTAQADLIKDIDLLSSYAIAKYWHDYQTQIDAIAGLMGAIGHQQWVGSGRIASKPSLLLDPAGGSSDVVIDYLAFGMAPVDFGIDLPNSNNGAIDAATGQFHSEAWQLLGYNSSALEHNVVEEIASANSVSTIKGLQRASQQNLGVSIPGDSTPAVTDDVISVFESRPGVGDARNVYHVYNIRVGSTNGVQIISPAGGQLLNANSFSNLLSSHNHNSATQIDDSLWAFLSNQQVNQIGPLDGVTGVVKAMATKHRTKVDSWTGSVYLTEVPGQSMQFAIQADGAGPTNGGYSGGVPTPPPPELQLGAFPNAGWAGDPVHVANGNMFRDETDIVFPNIGVPLTFSRHYDSQSKDDVGMGVGWTYSFSDMLYLDEKGTPGTSDDEVVWIAASGARHRFKKLADGTYTTPAELKGKLTRLATNEFVTGGYKYVYLDPSGMEYHFQEINDVDPFNGFNGPYTSIGRLRLQRDEQGNGVRIDYIHPTQFHGFTEIRDLHDPARRLVYTYGTAGRVTTITKHDGAIVPQTWTYGYVDVTMTGVVDSEKRLASVTSPAVGVVNASYQESTTSTTTTYDYYNTAAGDPAYAKGLIKKITEADGSWHTYEYYRNGRAFRVKQGEAGVAENSPQVDLQTFNYNLFRNVTEFTDERGNLETYVHQKNGLLEKQIHADRSQTKTKWGAYNAGVLVPDTEFLMTSTTDERGAVENFTYYSASDFKKGQLQTSTAKSYSPATALLTTYDYVQPDSSKLHLVALSTAVVDPDASPYVGKKITTTREYYSSGDAKGKLSRTTDAENNVVEYSYYVSADGGPAYRLGLLKSIKQPAILDPNDPDDQDTVTYETLFNYNAAGNVTSTATQTVAGTPIVVAQETFAYDSLGNVVQRIVGAHVVAERVVTESVYDALGRLRETGFADANAAVDPIDGFTSRFKYDKSGRVREAIDPLGRVTRFEYDRQGNVVKQIDPDGTALLHAYDAFGNCIAKTDALGRTTRFVYDGRNRLVQTIRPDGALESVRYDGAGNVVASTDALGNVTTFRYDASGRLIETKLPDPNSPTGTANPTTTNKYDKLGNLIETIDPEFNVAQFKYDKLGRVVESRTIDGREFANKNSAQKLGIRNSGVSYVPTLGHNPVTLITTDYDAVGNVKQTVAYDVTSLGSIPADARTLITAQNIADNKVQVVAMRYDAFGRPVKTINADDTVTSATYDAAGRVIEQKDELLRVTLFEYDLFGRLTKTTLPDPDGSATAYASPVTSYRYDAAGNRIATIDPRGFTTRFEYDFFNRLTATVDAQGNRTRTVYDVAGQMVATVDALGRAAYVRYDERGRAVEQRQADPDGAGPGVAPVTRSRYDAASRIIESIDPLGYSTLYQHDRLGRVTKETFATDFHVADDVAGGDAAFNVITGLVSFVNQPADYGADSQLIVSNEAPGAVAGARVLWRFDGLEKGATYRVLASWTANSSAATDLVFRLSDVYHDPTPNDGIDNGVVDFWPEDYLTGGPNQRQATSDQVRFENGVASGWKELHAGFTISSSPNSLGALAIHFYSSQAIHADAIRIERISSRSYQYDANGNLLKETDPLGRETTYAYDELDRVVTETLPDPDGASALLSPQTTTSYDGYGNVKSVLERRGNGAEQRTTTFAYDSRNRRTEEIFDVGVDGQNGVDYVNRKTVFDYDDVGNLEHRREYAQDAATPSAFDLLRTTSYRYDKLDRQILETLNSNGNDNDVALDERLTFTTYDANGNVSQVVANLGAGGAALTTTFRYDALNRTVQETASSSSQSRVTRFQYDAAGQQIAAIDPRLRVSRNEFDRLGRVVKSTDPDPDASGSLASHVTLFGYDAAGQLIAKNNGGNFTFGAHELDLYAYDPQGRLIRSESGRGDVTRRFYDAAGNLEKLVDPAGNVTTYQYDKLDRIKFETNAAGLSREFIYDKNGNLFVTVDRNGEAIRRMYDRLDRVRLERWYPSRGEAISGSGDGTTVNRTDDFRFSYDDLGRLVQQSHYVRSSERYVIDAYAYDGLDRTVLHTNQDLLTPAGPHSTGVPALQQTYAYAYDSAGLTVTREQSVAGQFAASTKSTYNAFGELVRQEDKEVNAAGAASAILDFESTDAVFTYLGDGSLASTTRYTDWDPAIAGHRNRVQSTYAYDNAGRLKNIAHAQNRRSTATWPGVDTAIVAFAYGYDAADRINSIETDWNVTGQTAFANRTDETQNLSYDAAGQLTWSTSNLPGHSGDYSYGLNGNRSWSGENGLAQYAYQNGNNRVTNDVRYSYQYDDEGNLIRRTSAADATDYETYSWDQRNRLTKVNRYVDAALVESVAYRYNAADDLIYRSSNLSGTEHYVVESGQRTMTVETDGDVKRRIQYGATGEVLFDQVFDAAGTPTLQSETDLLLPLGDYQGSTRVVLAHAGDDATYVRQSIDYAPFGRIVATLGANGAADAAGLVTPFAHHGSLYDAATGLQHKGERWYSPDLGRFISEDPIQDGANWYAFAGNDPVNHADPSGLYQQGHPLSGGYSGNNTIEPTIPSGNLFTAAVNAIGYAIGQGLGAIAGALTSSRSTSNQLVNNFTTLNDFSSITGTPAPDYSLRMSPAGASLRDYQLEQMRQAMGRAHAEELNFLAIRNSIYAATPADDVRGTANVATAVGPQSDVRDVIETVSGYNVIEQEPLSTRQRVVTGVSIFVPLVGGVVLRRLLNAGETAQDAARASGVGRPSPSVDHQVAPNKKPIDASRNQHGTPTHHATAMDVARRWDSDAATVQARFNQQLIDASGNSVPGLRPDAQRIRTTSSGQRVVDVVEVRSPTQSRAQMNAKMEQYRSTLGSQAGHIEWIEPLPGAKQ